jgi:hypothetical protein
MSVHVDQTWAHHAPAGVELQRSERSAARACSGLDRDDEPALD